MRPQSRIAIHLVNPQSGLNALRELHRTPGNILSSALREHSVVCYRHWLVQWTDRIWRQPRRLPTFPPPERAGVTRPLVRGPKCSAATLTVRCSCSKPVVPSACRPRTGQTRLRPMATSGHALGAAQSEADAVAAKGVQRRLAVVAWDKPARQGTVKRRPVRKRL